MTAVDGLSVSLLGWLKEATSVHTNSFSWLLSDDREVSCWRFNFLQFWSDFFPIQKPEELWGKWMYNYIIQTWAIVQFPSQYLVHLDLNSLLMSLFSSSILCLSCSSIHCSRTHSRHNSSLKQEYTRDRHKIHIPCCVSLTQILSLEKPTLQD